MSLWPVKKEHVWNVDITLTLDTFHFLANSHYDTWRFALITALEVICNYM